VLKQIWRNSRADGAVQSGVRRAFYALPHKVQMKEDYGYE